MLALVVLTACRDSSAGEARTTVPTRPPMSSTTATTAVSYDVPTVIDAAYVEKVMAALDHVEGEAIRRAAAERQLDTEFFSYFASIYTDRYFKLVQRAWLEIAGNSFQSLSPNPIGPSSDVVRLISTSPDCIFFEARRSFSGVFISPEPAQRQRFVALLPIQNDRNSAGHNPTPWMMNFDGNLVSGNEPTAMNACARE